MAEITVEGDPTIRRITAQANEVAQALADQLGGVGAKVDELETLRREFLDTVGKIQANAIAAGSAWVPKPEVELENHWRPRAVLPAGTTRTHLSKLGEIRFE